MFDLCKRRKKTVPSNEGTEEDAIPPAQDAGHSGNPIPEPSGRSPGQAATRENGFIVLNPERLVNRKERSGGVAAVQRSQQNDESSCFMCFH